MLKQPVRQISAGFLLKSIAAEKLAALLIDLPVGSAVQVNQVGNLAVFVGDVQVGYIDLSTEDYMEDG